MFSSSNNINPFPQHPSGSSSSSAFQVPFMGGGGGGEGFFPYHLHDPLSGYLVPSASYYNTNAPISHEALISNMAVLSGKKDGGNGSKKAVRKDRHSKICTSQGLRDRRVRLSIEISREFFDLQDMLGFDKASKTLEWLLDKSRKDIKQLEEQIKHSKGNANNSDLEVNDDVEDEGGDDPAEKKMKKSSNKDDYARECRAKARERARERTKEKLCTSNSNNNNSSSTTTTTTATRMLQEPRKCTPDHHQQQHHHHSNPYVFTQLRSACEDQLGSHNGPSNAGCYQQQANQPIIEDIIQESIVIKRKLMKSPLVSDSSRGFVDWDISSAMTRSSLCSGNLSTELQMYGKH